MLFIWEQMILKGVYTIVSKTYIFMYVCEREISVIIV